MKTVKGINLLADQRSVDCIPLIYPDNEGPWALRYTWIKPRTDGEFTADYHKVEGGKKANIRSKTADVAEHWRAFNSLMINYGHLGDLVWRLKVTNPLNNSVDVVEVWRDRELIEDYFQFKHHDNVAIPQATVANPHVAPALTRIEDGGTGLKNGSGLTIHDPLAPRVYSRQDHEALSKAIWESGFEFRIWDEYPLISPAWAVAAYEHLTSRVDLKVTINTGYNPTLNPVHDRSTGHPVHAY